LGLTEDTLTKLNTPSKDEKRIDGVSDAVYESYLNLKAKYDQLQKDKLRQASTMASPMEAIFKGIDARNKIMLNALSEVVPPTFCYKKKFRFNRS